MKKNNLMSGALILSVGSVLAKVFSAIYRIGLTRILGGEGIGIYQLIFPLYSLCVVLATAGLPMAISKVIAKNQGCEKVVLKKCFCFSALVSLCLTMLLIVCSKPLAILQGKQEIYICYILLAPAVLIVSFISVLRGYFQGKHNFFPSAISNIIEQAIKLFLGLCLSVILLKKGLIFAIIGAMLGITISELFSLVVLIVLIKKENIKEVSGCNVELKGLMQDILPITLTNLVLPIATFIDSLLVVNLLANNFTKSMSIFLYGLESGAVSSLVNLPTIFSFAIASVILPNIAKLKSNHNKTKNLSLSIKIILIICVPCVVCFTLIPNRIIELLYSNKLNGLGVEGLNITFRLLTLSGFGVVFLALNQVFSSSLQAIDKRYVTVRNLIIAVVIKFVIEFIFLPSKQINIYALSVSNSVCYITAMVLNYLEVKLHFKMKFNITFVAKLVLSTSVMILTLILILMFNNSWINTLLALFVSAVVYLFCLYKTKILSASDLAMFKYRV